MTEIEEHQRKYSEEIKEKYGNTSAYKESNKKHPNIQRKTGSNIMKGWDEIYKKLANLMDKNPE